MLSGPKHVVRRGRTVKNREPAMCAEIALVKMNSKQALGKGSKSEREYYKTQEERKKQTVEQMTTFAAGAWCKAGGV